MSSKAVEEVLVAGASQTAIGAVLQQEVNGKVQPLVFPQTRYSAFGRELLPIHPTAQHFGHLLGSRLSAILTDHKPLTFALNATPERHSPRESRQLNYISQFTADIRHISGQGNSVTDALFRAHINQLTHCIQLETHLEKPAARQIVAEAHALCCAEVFPTSSL